MSEKKFLIIVSIIGIVGIIGITIEEVTETIYKKTPHEQRMEVLKEIEYENRILDDINREEGIRRFKQELDSLHHIQDSLLKLK